MLRDRRNNYLKSELLETNIAANPFEQIGLWLSNAIDEGQPEATAMVLSTIDQNGFPDSRVVLLKEISEEGFIFFTNYDSKKGRHISGNNHVSVNFFWPSTERQVRIKGVAEKIPDLQSEEYFRSRPIESQLGAWASPQSQIIESREILDKNFEKFRKQFENHEISKPSHWGGYLVKPVYFEFWQGRANRLHDRFEYCLSDKKWIIRRLAP